ncbi:hypothetical protein K443DRAFT_12811 [Laccaria amethystina LaAM-08-1]|uniref:Uncharacterized protein n=1 Tax=Laccaria amethystina LaAM-08-1 TaxID=1095629 RepID=A0A0C9X7H7_9AGAR|nr:hypothetical protein K443DRAFT_12811 [Laccaria amethystina LaAM-08-1]
MASIAVQGASPGSMPPSRFLTFPSPPLNVKTPFHNSGNVDSDVGQELETASSIRSSVGVGDGQRQGQG